MKPEDLIKEFPSEKIKEIAFKEYPEKYPVIGTVGYEMYHQKHDFNHEQRLAFIKGIHEGTAQCASIAAKKMEEIFDKTNVAAFKEIQRQDAQIEERDKLLEEAAGFPIMFGGAKPVIIKKPIRISKRESLKTQIN